MKITLVNLFAILIMSLELFSQSPLPIGGKAPDFIAKNSKGEEIRLSEELQKGPVVLIFYRGNWCKHCNSYMSNMEDSLSLITDAGARVIAITPEDFQYVELTREKTEASFQIIPDQGHKIMDMYQVSYKLGRMMTMGMSMMGIKIKEINATGDRVLPVPATYVIDERGIIRARHFNEDYRYRMPIKDIISAVEYVTYEFTYR